MITIEQLKEFATTPEGKEIFNSFAGEYAKEQGWKSPEEISGLVEKNRHLIVEMKKLKDRPSVDENDKILLDFLKEKNIFDNEDLEKVFSGQAKGEETTDEERRAHKKALKELEFLEAENSKINSLFDSERALRIKSLRDSELNDCLIEAKVKPEVIPVVKRFLVDEIKHEIGEDGGVKFFAKDEITTAKDFVMAWSKTEMAKTFIMKPESSGSGNHLKGAPGKKTYTREEIRQMPPEEKRKIMTDPSVEVAD